MRPINNSATTKVFGLYFSQILWALSDGLARFTIGPALKSPNLRSHLGTGDRLGNRKKKKSWRDGKITHHGGRNSKKIISQVFIDEHVLLQIRGAPITVAQALIKSLSSIIYIEFHCLLLYCILYCMTKCSSTIALQHVYILILKLQMRKSTWTNKRNNRRSMDASYSILGWNEVVSPKYHQYYGLLC